MPPYNRVDCADNFVVMDKQTCMISNSGQEWV